MNHYELPSGNAGGENEGGGKQPEEAEQFARDQWKRGEVVLDASHFTGVEFHAKRYSRDRGER